MLNCPRTDSVDTIFDSKSRFLTGVDHRRHAKGGAREGGRKRQETRVNVDPIKQSAPLTDIPITLINQVRGGEFRGIRCAACCCKFTNFVAMTTVLFSSIFISTSTDAICEENVQGGGGGGGTKAAAAAAGRLGKLQFKISAGRPRSAVV